MKLSTREMEGTVIVDVVGDIDLYNSPEMRKALIAALREKRSPRVVVNLSQVKYIDSSGVASLVEGYKISKETNARFVLFGLSPAAREVLELSRLIKIFEVYDNEAAALKAVC